jgi:hypothetical protein
MRQDEDCRTAIQQFQDRRHEALDARTVAHLPIVERHVEIGAQHHQPAGHRHIVEGAQMCQSHLLAAGS